MNKRRLFAIVLSLLMMITAIAPQTAITAFAATKPAQVTGLTLSSPTCGKVKIAYKSVKGASGYAIYYKASKNDSYKLIKRTTNRSYTYEVGSNKYGYYRVRAYKTSNGKRIYGKYSSAKTIRAKKHTYGSYILTKMPTCTTKGSKYKVCSRCNKKVTASIPVDTIEGHSYVIKAATCTTNGKKYCKYCNKVSTSYVAKATGHNYSTSKVTKKATCTASGTRTFYCSKCSATKTETIAKLGHNLDAGVTKNATCTESATKTYSCSRCSYTRVDKIGAPLGHNPVNAVITKQPTCVEAGTKVSTCSRCNIEITEDIAIIPDNHNISSEVTKAPTCTEPGERTYTCADCGATNVEPIAPTGEHSFANPAPNGDETHTLSCIYGCDEKMVAPCNYGASTVIKEATLEEAGIIEYRCHDCDFNFQAPIAYECEHSDVYWVTFYNTEPTCTSKGYTGDVLCMICEAIIDTGEEIPMIEHSYEEISTPATCDNPASTAHICTMCGDVVDMTETAPALGHSYIYNEAQPTCTTDGYKQAECEVCGVAKNREIIPALGHSSELIEKSYSFCDAKGYIEHICPVCSEVVDTDLDAIEPLSHDLSTATNELGYIVTSCSRCDYEKVDTTCYINLTERTISVPAVAEFRVTATTGRDVLELTYDGVSNYEITGSANNLTIEIDATDDCEVKLNGVTIINNSIGVDDNGEAIVGDCITIKNKSNSADSAPMVSISAKDGTVNTLKVLADGGNAIQSSAKLELKGHGKLVMNTKSTAIDARAKVYIRNLTLDITSANRGIDTKYEVPKLDVNGDPAKDVNGNILTSNEYANIELGANATITINATSDGIRCKNMDFIAINADDTDSVITVISGDDALQLEGGASTRASSLIMYSGILNLNGTKSDINNKSGKAPVKQNTAVINHVDR